jgi:hypothetical protein
MPEVTSSMRAQGVKAAAVVLAAAVAFANGLGSVTAGAAAGPVALAPAEPVTFAEGADMIPVDAMELEPEGGG